MAAALGRKRSKLRTSARSDCARAPKITCVREEKRLVSKGISTERGVALVEELAHRFQEHDAIIHGTTRNPSVPGDRFTSKKCEH
jgi:hypothetical protein